METPSPAPETTPGSGTLKAILPVSVRPWQLLAAVALVLILVAARYAMRPRDYPTALADGNYRAAEQLLLKQAETGDLAAQNALANLYYLGLGIDRDYAKAAHWYLKAALAGYTDAQINISHLYRLGQGVPRDKMRALGWLTVARKGNNERAEGHIKWQAVRLQMSLAQREFVHKHYSTVEGLDPANAPPER